MRATTTLIVAAAAFSQMCCLASAEPPTRDLKPAPPAPPACLQRLVAEGIEVRAAPAPATGGACTVVDPVNLISASVPDATGERIAFPERPLLSCAMAEAFGRFAQDLAAPLSKGLYGQSLKAIATGPGYECRTRNHVPGAKISAHAQGNALDVAMLIIADGTKIAVATPESDKARRLIAGLRAAGCGTFSTVLGPGSDAAHATHLHFDIEARGRDGKSKFCQ